MLPVLVNTVLPSACGTPGKALAEAIREAVMARSTTAGIGVTRLIGLALIAGLVAVFTGVHHAAAQQPKSQPKAAPPVPLRLGFSLPPPGETRFVPNEVMLDVPASVPPVT